MDDVDALIDRCREKLGEPDGVFRPAPLGRNLLRGGGMLVGGLAVAGGVIAVAPGAAAGAAKFLFALPAVGGVLVYHTLKARGRAVLTYPDGVLPVGRGEVNWLPWDAVAAVHLRAKDGAVELTGDEAGAVAGCVVTAEPPGVLLNTARLTLHRDGDAAPLLVSPALVGYDRLVVRAQLETFARRWPGVRDRFAAGETVPFGPFDLHPDALGHGSRTLPWDRLRSLDLKGGKVVVKKRGRWLAWAAEPLEKVPDPHLFFALAEHARHRPAAAESDSTDVGDHL